MTHRPLIAIVLSFAIGISIDYFFNIPSLFVFPLITITVFVQLCLFIIFPSSVNSPSQNSLSATFPVRLSGARFSGRIPNWLVVRQAGSKVLILLILILLTGMVYHHFKCLSYTTDNITNLISAKKIPVRLRGIVITPPVNKFTKYSPVFSPRQRTELTTFLLQLEGIDRQGDWKGTTGVIKVKVYSLKHEENVLNNELHDELNKEKNFLENILKYGDRINLTGNISTPSISGNPGQFNYKKYLHRQNPRIDAVVSIVNAGNIKIVSENHGNYFFAFTYGLKKKLSGILKEYINQKSVPLVGSILLGDREKIPEDLMDSFLQTGTIHFLAISGLHVGILVISLHYVLRLLRLNTRSLSMIIILFAVLYTVITGMKTPITRAFIMVAVYYGAFIFNRRWDLINSIAAAVIVILLINPADLFNVGFQLSILALLGIIYLSNRIENFLWKSTLLVEKLQAREERNEYWFLFKLYCRKTFCVSLAAWISVMPLIAFYFHIVTPLAVLLNIIVLPLIWLILVSGFVVLLIGLVLPILITPFAWITSYSAMALESVVSFFSFGFESGIKTFFYTPGLSWIWIIVYYLVVVLFVLRERYKIKMVYVLIATLAVSNIFIFSHFLVNNKNCLKLTCFDVKHGTSIFIEFPNGKNMLFDTGTWNNYDVGKFVVAPFLWQKGIKKIDTVIISHEHNDHCNGIPTLIERFKVDNVFVNKFLLQNGKKKELLRFITNKDIKTGLLANGLEIEGYSPARITVLNPPDKDTLRRKGFPVDNISVNDSSCVLLIEYLGHKILLCADIGEKGIDFLLSTKDDLTVDVIQVPHHGGSCTKTENLIKWARPAYAIISGNEKIVSPSTIDAYEKSGANVLKTFQDGAITFKINEDGIKVSKFLRQD